MREVVHNGFNRRKKKITIEEIKSLNQALKGEVVMMNNKRYIIIGDNKVKLRYWLCEMLVDKKLSQKEFDEKIRASY